MASSPESRSPRHGSGTDSNEDKWPQAALEQLVVSQESLPALACHVVAESELERHRQAGRYLSRHGLSPDGLRVTVDHDMAADRAARVAAVRVRLAAPKTLPQHRRRALLVVASH